MQYLPLVPVSLAVGYVLYVLGRLRGVEPAASEAARPRRHVLTRTLVIALLLLASGYFAWYMPATVPGAVWDRASEIELPEWFAIEEQLARASPLHWQVVFTGTSQRDQSWAEVVYTYNRLSGSDHMRIHVGTVAARQDRTAVGGICLAVALLAMWAGRHQFRTPGRHL